MMLHRIEIYREPYSSIKAKDSEFKLSLLQTIESEDLSAVIDLGINFMRSEFEFADLTADDLNVGNFICSERRCFKIALSIFSRRFVLIYPYYFL